VTLRDVMKQSNRVCFPDLIDTKAEGGRERETAALWAGYKTQCRTRGEAAGRVPFPLRVVNQDEEATT